MDGRAPGLGPGLSCVGRRVFNACGRALLLDIRALAAFYGVRFVTEYFTPLLDIWRDSFKPGRGRHFPRFGRLFLRRNECFAF
jgi:hypothetical protein